MFAQFTPGTGVCWLTRRCIGRTRRSLRSLSRPPLNASIVSQTMRAALLLSILCAAGCATARISLTGARGELRFHFDERGKPLVVGGIDVFEQENDRPGEKVCAMTPPADSRTLSDWVYGQGHDISRPEQLRCEALATGRRYSIHVFHSYHCIVTMDFAILANGTAQPLGPSNDGCWM